MCKIIDIQFYRKVINHQFTIKYYNLFRMKIHKSILILTTLLSCYLSSPLTDPLDEYINRPEPEFKWHYTGTSFMTLTGGRAYVLNVTSIRWLDDSEYKVSGGSSLWTHEIVVIIPRHHVFKNVASFYLASADARCNTDAPITDALNFDLEMGDIFSSDSRAIGVVSFQTPNCPMVFKDDPDKHHRREDSQIAWALREFFMKPDHKPERLIFMPMAKAALY